MSRPLRIQYPGAVYIENQGNMIYEATNTYYFGNIYL
jgi:hypothetical protein